MSTSLLLVVPFVLQVVDGRFGVDQQTWSGLIRWAEQFDRLVVACPVLPESQSKAFSALETWKAIEELPCADRIEFVPLPYAYKPSEFVRHYRNIRALLSRKIQECKYLCFSPSVWIGDWAGVACSEAIRLDRPYAVWTDRVEYEVIWRTLRDNPSLKTRLKEFLTLPLTKRYVHHLIRHSQLGLFQGQDCYSVYAPLSSNPHCVYDIHTQKSDQIDPAKVAAKIEQVASGQLLRICYVGRATEMKGPIDWIHVIDRLHQAGLRVKATWLGDGNSLPEMRQLAEQLNLSDCIEFGGFVRDRQQILETMRQHHIFMFCHKTPESPRCLVEALVSGTPIVGYDSAYPRGLVAEYGGGIFTPLHDQAALAEQVLELNRDRSKLCDLIREAAKSGKLYDEETVFQHRSDLIKRYL